MSVLLTAGDALEVIGPGVSWKQLRSWTEKGIVTPVEGGDGSGDYRKYTVMQVVGLAVAAKLMATERGCAPAYVKVVVAAFAATDPAWLEVKFGEGRTHFLDEHDGRPRLLKPDQFGPGCEAVVDVETTYRGVLKKVAEIAKRPAPASGRGRGLPGAAVVAKG